MRAATLRAPWRDVVGRTGGGPAEDGLVTGRGSVLGPETSRRTAWWELRLSCGHDVCRTVRYTPRPGAHRGGTQHRRTSDALPPPRRVRCELCPAQPFPILPG